MKKSIIYRFLLLAFLCIHISACRKKLTTDELEKYIANSENGFKKEFERGTFKAEMVYRPTDLMVMQELKTGRKDLLTLKKKYGQYYYFVLSLQNNGSDLLNSTVSDKSVFAGIIEQLSFKMNDVIYAIDGNKDTTYLADFAFPRLYEAARSTSVLLAFKEDAIKTNKFKICIKDIGYTAGIIEFDFDKKDIENIPSLKL